MAVKYMLDTSVVKRVSSDGVRAVVRTLALAGEIGRTSIIDLEVGCSARNGDEWSELTGVLGSFPLVSFTQSHFDRALQVQALLASRSQRGRKIPDLLVAAAAEEIGATVLHYDSDFDIISSVTGQPTEWVVPAGTVD
jgi:predicted nucleic acid-binding protein